DYYHQISQDVDKVPGNPWFICTMWLAQYDIAAAHSADGLKDAVEMLEWVADHALPSGCLAEQVHPFNNEPLSVSPLTWSHATFVTCVLEYLEKRRQLMSESVFSHTIIPV
ncbi:glycoside hydrolase family 15 protein, partial [bacterium]|nr:glycoside hydrolase family 15 protein [bacterium]